MAQFSRWSQAFQREVLLSHGPPVEGPDWLRCVPDALEPSGWVFCRAHSGPDTIRRVERGGLSAAVLVADESQIDGLSLLRIIRTIDVTLPCWLITPDTARHTLEAALALRVTSIMTYPVEVNELTLGLKKLLVGGVGGADSSNRAFD